MDGLAESIDQIAASSSFSGVVRIDRQDDSSFAAAYGLAHRGHCIANTVDTRFGLASGTKGLTAMAVMTLVESDELELATTARSVMRSDLPLIDDGVTVEHLLAHRSGIGDYLDEETVAAPTDFVMPVPVHVLSTTEAYLGVLAGYRQVFPTRRPLLVQQRWIRRARSDRRARERDPLSATCARARMPARRHG